MADIGKIQPVEIVEEMQKSYLDYAMSVIVARALPDVRDGLKPVHRRIIYAMQKIGLTHSAHYSKSAKVVGEVLGKYHPHGDAPVYEALVRMAQDFSMRAPLIDGQGNFGCFTKDTKVKLTDGRSLTFGNLIKENKEGKKHWTFSVNLENQKIEIAQITNPRLTRKKAQLIEVILDNGAKIRCTPNHRFMLRNGSYKQAKDLKNGESLMPLYEQKFSGEDKNLKGYLQLMQPQNKLWEFVHHLADAWNLKNKIYPKSSGRIRHHLDLNKYNNNPDNIKRMHWKEHWQIHHQLTALKYFKDFTELVSQAQTYNHKIVSVKKLNQREDVYDLTVEPWHNFALDAGIFVHNSVDGDSPAAMRYTETRLAAISETLLYDLEKNTVDWVDNFDGSLKEPTFLPAVLPNLLVNGSSGIAVGMATNIPPHNLNEIVDATIHLIDNPQAQVEDLMNYVRGPDFPTGAQIYDIAEITAAYATGRGKIMMRARAEIEETKAGRFQIVVWEIPYQVNKATLVTRIADLVKDKKLDGISDLRDESDRKGMRVVIELKRDARPQAVLNNLYKHTALQQSFPVNMVALVNGIPQTLTLKMILEEFRKHRQLVITRRSQFELDEAKKREHILEGLKIAVDNIDAVIETIKKSRDAEDAKVNLMQKFKLTEVQALAILDMQLKKLAALERQKIEEELKMTRELIAYLEDLLTSPEKILKVAKDELVKLKEKFGDERRTKVYKQKIGEFREEDLIPNEPTIVTITQGGYVKRQDIGSFRTQRRGGKGVSGITTKEEDIVSQLFATHAHDNLLFFTNRGRVFQLKVWELPDSSRVAKGVAIVNLLELSQDEKILSILPVKKQTSARESKNNFVLMATKNGTVKKTAITSYEAIRRSGIIAIKLTPGDQLRWAKLTDGNDLVFLVSKRGMSIKFDERDVRPMARDTMGVRGLKLKAGDELIGMDVIGGQDDRADLLVVTEKGIGKKTQSSAWPKQLRGGVGVKVANLTDKTGDVVCAQILTREDEGLILTSQKGQVIRTTLRSIPRLTRDTQGVIVMRLSQGDKVAAATVIAKRKEDEMPANLKELEGQTQTETPPKSKSPKTKVVKVQPKVQKETPKRQITKESNSSIARIKVPSEARILIQRKAPLIQRKAPLIVKKFKRR